MSGGAYEYKCLAVRDFAELMHTHGDEKRIKFKILMELVAAACKAIEWEDSGDTCPEHTAKAIDEVFVFLARYWG